MYFKTCWSLSPLRSITRTSSRRSTARSACESAIVWFWHTRQRSSVAMRIMRASSAGSAAASGASLAHAPMPVSTSSIEMNSLRIEFLQQRLDALGDHLRRERADVLHADHAALVDDECLGHAVDAEVDADAAVLVEDGRVIGVAELVEPAHAVGALVFVVEADDGQRLGLRELDQQGVLFAAGHAP